jgi:dolichol-phosphate mannosyltransferase
MAQSFATITAMTFNFFINNITTYRHISLRGFRQITRGVLSFYAICGAGAILNVGIASLIFQQNHSWWTAGIGGVLVGAVWNYAMTSMYTWQGARTN